MTWPILTFCLHIIPQLDLSECYHSKMNLHHFDLSHITLLFIALTTIIMCMYLRLLSLSPARLETPARTSTMSFFWFHDFPNTKHNA